MTKEPEYKGNATDFYVATGDIAEVVNLAVELGRPLLVEGEPGCGKTLLASSIATEKGLKLIKISVKSTSRARDLLYRFDALRRLQDAQDPNNKLAQSIYPYLDLGPMGEAIQAGERCVVLIDEIDKADIDFPNDLLDVLDQFEFTIDELPAKEEARCLKDRKFGRVVSAPAEVRPIVVITTNREKQLPEPFLRRCLFAHVRFPEDPAVLQQIVRKNLGRDSLPDELLRRAVLSFQEVRNAALASDAQKLPTTSELIDWVKILHSRNIGAEALEGSGQFPPYWRTLFKTMQDLESYSKGAKQ